jgi:anti-sigma-K factor RskA
MRELTHEEAAELLALGALDALVPEDAARLLTHAARCSGCGSALAALREVAAQLALAAPTRADDPARRARVRTRLLARAAADAEPQPAASTEARRSLPAPRRAWALPALAGLAAVLVLAIMQSRVIALERQVASMRTEDSLRIDQLDASVASRDSVLRDVTGQRVSAIRLTAATSRAPWAWMFWNHADNRWTFVGHELPAPVAGKTYQLWLVTKSAKVSAGTFAPRPDGSAELQATYAMAPDALRGIAVTLEPAGGVPQPTGPFVITATAE